MILGADGKQVPPTAEEVREHISEHKDPRIREACHFERDGWCLLADPVQLDIDNPIGEALSALLGVGAVMIVLFAIYGLWIVCR